MFNGNFPVPRLLLSVLYLTGLNESSKKTIWNRLTLVIFGVLLHFTCVDTWYIIIKELGTEFMKVGISYLISFSLTIAVWYTTLYKRKHIKNLLQNIKDIKSSSGERTINFLVLLYYIISISLSIVEANELKNWNDKSAFTYGRNMGNHVTKFAFLYFKVNLTYLIYPTYTNIIVLLYGTLCLRCTTYINLLSQEITLYSPETFELPKQLDILKRKARIKGTLMTIQDIFSLPILLIMIENVTMCGSMTGWYLMNSWNKSLITWKIETMYYGINAFLSVVCILWVAGALPIAMNKFKETFYSKTHARLLYYHSKDELYLKGEVINEPDFILTGCEMVSFKRSTILVFIGTLLTYTVLIVSTDSK
ncbi:uncharacterized protein TNCT_3441 [Trichonephila clavata]|uniref:Uncharacterized protein n=1 Tax=Trichonephila clavata TaxID=2740835 RepID=A0A8X6LTB1_TRICU|nr:uncharacterized protein TNCT_3441 [Trichonephila clavata]